MSRRPASAQDLAVLRDVFGWARSAGWKRTLDLSEHPRCIEWQAPAANHRIHVYVDDADLTVYVHRDNVAQPLQVADVREAVDLLCVLGVLPRGFSSLYQAGFDAGASVARATRNAAFRAGVAGRKLATPAPPKVYAKPRGVCAVCERESSLTIDGNVQAHDAPRSPGGHYIGICKGSRTPPKAVADASA